MLNLKRRYKRVLEFHCERMPAMAAMNIIQWVEKIDDAADFNVTFIEKIIF